MQSENLPDEANPDYRPTHEEIEHLAYNLWVKSGEKPGHDEENWCTARRMLIEQHHHRHRHHHGDLGPVGRIPPGPHTNLEGGNSHMSNQKEENENQELENDQLDSSNDLGDEDVDPSVSEDEKNKGGSDNTADAKPMETDKSNQPPIGGSEEEPDPNSPTHSQNVGPNLTPGGNGDPANPGPLSTGADNLGQK